MESNPKDILKDNIVAQFGKQIFNKKEITRLDGLLCDYLSHDQVNLKLFRLAIKDNIAHELLQADGTDPAGKEIKIKMLKTKFQSDNLLVEKAAFEIVDCFAYALGWDHHAEIQPDSPPVQKKPKESTNEPAEVTKPAIPTQKTVKKRNTNVPPKTSLDTELTSLLKQGQKKQALALCRLKTGLNISDSYLYLKRLNYFLINTYATEVTWQYYLKKSKRNRFWSRFVACITIPFALILSTGFLVFIGKRDFPTAIVILILILGVSIPTIVWLKKTRKSKI